MKEPHEEWNEIRRQMVANIGRGRVEVSAPEEIAFLTEQVNRLRRERAEAYAAGQERMRERAAKVIEEMGFDSTPDELEGLATDVRLLPIETSQA